jgi:hypothetical protein
MTERTRLSETQNSPSSAGSWVGTEVRHLSQASDASQRRRVRVWFGSEVICSHAADPAEAKRYARLMARRFAGLTVTIDDQPGEKDTGLPHELLWERTIR